jgi:hypothetical protein
MVKKYWKLVAIMVLVGVVLCVAASEKKGKKKAKKLAAPEAAQEQEVERHVTEAEVPAAALATLKKMAGDAEIYEFAEETELGSTFYEGSWKNPAGANVDVIVTPTGDLVEIEEQIGADQVPPAALKAARKAAGKETEIMFEKKTMFLYEIKFQKGESGHELLLSPDGRRIEEEVTKGKPD